VAGRWSRAPAAAWAPQDAVRAHPPEDPHRQITEQISDAGSVVPSVEHDQDLRVTLAPLGSLDEALHDIADLIW
jgi:hypothetical protein